MDLEIKPLNAGLWSALEDLFGRSGASNGCWCMYWRIGPKYHDRPREQNKEELRTLAGSRPQPVGWCEVAPRAELDWLAHARHLQPVDDLPVWSVPCFYIRRTHRGLGVMDAL